MIFQEDDIEKLDYNKSYNITIAVSGETRNYNSLQGTHLRKFVSILKNLGHRVSLVGHTWEHCDLPNNEHNKFLRIQIDKQDIIKDWMLENIFLRAPLNKNLNIDINKTDFNSIINEHADMAKRMYGQVWSALTAIKLANSTDPDVCIRWRWDLSYENKFSEKSNAKLNKAYVKKLDNYYLDLAIRKVAATKNRPILLTSSNTMLSPSYVPRGYGFMVTATIEDTAMFLNRASYNKIVEHDISTGFDKVFKDELRGDSTADGHTLWYSYLSKNFPQISYSVEFPNAFWIIR